jgi:uncharacterized protein
MNHIPVRNCAACRSKLPKAELIRIVRSPDGRVFFDAKGKSDGRGLYWCGQKKCLDRIKKKGIISRMFGVNEPEEIFDELKEVIRGD